MLDKASSPRERLAVMVRQIISDHPLARPDHIEINLREAGLTSLDLVKLVLRIEDGFGVVFGPDDMDPEHFETLDALERLVAQLQS